MPVWFRGTNLPTDEEYDAHVKNKLLSSLSEHFSIQQHEDSDASDSEYASDEYPASEEETESSDDDGN